jgi:hypothetical protein
MTSWVLFLSRPDDCKLLGLLQDHPGGHGQCKMLFLWVTLTILPGLVILDH